MPSVDPVVLDKIKGEILAAATRRNQALQELQRAEAAVQSAQAKVEHEEASINLGRNFLSQLGLDPTAVLNGVI